MERRAVRGVRLEEAASSRSSSEEPPLVGAVLRQIRQDRGLSLARLSEASGVSRAMLSQIELGQSVPTITVLWRVSTALGISFSALLNPEGADEAPPKFFDVPLREARSRTSRRGGISWRPLHPPDYPRQADFYELRLAPRAEERLEAKTPNTVENLVVASGTVELVVLGERRVLKTGDAILTPADHPRVYRNLGTSEALCYVVLGQSLAH